MVRVINLKAIHNIMAINQSFVVFHCDYIPFHEPGCKLTVSFLACANLDNLKRPTLTLVSMGSNSIELNISERFGFKKKLLPSMIDTRVCTFLHNPICFLIAKYCTGGSRGVDSPDNLGLVCGGEASGKAGKGEKRVQLE
jgi:hypothetical protein